MTHFSYHTFSGFTAEDAVKLATTTYTNCLESVDLSHDEKQVYFYLCIVQLCLTCCKGREITVGHYCPHLRIISRNALSVIIIT